VSVGLVDCYPALLVLACGLLCSVAMLLLELALGYWRRQGQQHTGRFTFNYVD